MRVLVIGSGGREHALAWKLGQSPQVERVLVAPGNGGTAVTAENVAIAGTDISALVDFARREGIDLTVVGPEAPLVAGAVDAFAAAGLRAFGPRAAAAQLEGSKAFAKQFMVEEGIPSAPAAVFSTHETALGYVRAQEGPLVIKASGLAAGKGVLVCSTKAEAEAALQRVMVERAFGSAGDRVLVEARIDGEEASVLAFSDGKTVVPMPPARDYKRALDGDRGLNTGGMGGYAPSPHLPPPLVQEIAARVLQPTVDGMRRRGTPYVGVLYAGLMLTDLGPRVLEFNCRFGDPETQLLLPLLETDLVDILLACIAGRLDEVDVRWKPAYNVGLVLASGGYPGAYEKMKRIGGLDKAASLADVVFHAGTKREAGQLVTSGGRVLAVTATAKTLEQARDRAYAAAKPIHFDGLQVRSDIALLSGSEARPGIPPTPPRPGAYAAAGVDIDAGDRAVELMKEAVEQTYTTDVLGGIGAFGGSLSLERLARAHAVVLVASTDGVGTKTMVAAQMGVYHTVGHDIVNHCVNDVLVQGARPLFFLDYIAAARLDPLHIAAVVGGCAEACRAVDCVLIGGETAEMPGVYHPNAFDLVGTMVGWVDRPAMVDGRDVRPGDVLLGLPSSGLHTNGFSLARHVFRDTPWETVLPELGKPLGQVLLTPHRPYLHEVEALWDEGITIKAMAHITGGGFAGNIPRVLPDSIAARVDRAAWDPLPIFHAIQARGGVDEMEMYRVFNMGIGMVLVVSPRDVDRALSALPEMRVVGETVAWDERSPRVEL
jgi:phosphoribosylamine--glycine ligase/phosphoribosylformylglycinamidine cyclo-ligase